MDMTEARDFEAEILSATVAADWALLAKLALEHGKYHAEDLDRKRKAREKKQGQRGTDRGNDGTDGDKAGQLTGTDGDAEGQPPSPLPSLSSPRPLLNSSFPPSPASSSPSTAEEIAANVENCRTVGEPDAETALAQRLENDADRAALTAVIAAAPFRPSWIAELTASLDGMHGDPLTPRQLGVILRDYVGNGDHLRPNFKHFRAYLSRPDRPSADAAVFASANGRTKTGPPASDAVKILGKIRGLIQQSDTVANGIRRFIPRKDVEALEGEYPGTIAAYIAIGGADAILGCEPAKLSFLTRDFAAALQAARGG
jgi:hypothetical protein